MTVFYSSHVFSWIDEAHLHFGGQSALFKIHQFICKSYLKRLPQKYPEKCWIKCWALWFSQADSEKWLSEKVRWAEKWPLSNREVIGDFRWHSFDGMVGKENLIGRGPWESTQQEEGFFCYEPKTPCTSGFTAHEGKETCLWVSMNHQGRLTHCGLPALMKEPGDKMRNERRAPLSGSQRSERAYCHPRSLVRHVATPGGGALENDILSLSPQDSHRLISIKCDFIINGYKKYISKHIHESIRNNECQI